MTRSCMHAGSHDLLLYQHKARCTLGASSLPFISTGCRLCACICRTQGQIIFFVGGVHDWTGADCECTNVNISVLAHPRRQGQWDLIPGPVSRDSREGEGRSVTSKGPQRPAMPARPPRWEILFMWRGLPWHEKKSGKHQSLAFANAATTHAGLNPGPRCEPQYGRLLHLHRETKSEHKRIIFPECFDLRPETC